MTNQDREKFSLTMTALATTFGKEASVPLLEGYWMGLSDLSMEAFKRATSRALCESRFMPCVAELRALAGDIPPEQRAVIAWQAVVAALAKHGSYKSVDFDDPAINATIRNLGGWEALSDRLDVDAEKWVRKDFATVYEVYARRGVTADEGRPLGGYFDRTNHGNGYETNGQPARIATTLSPTKRIGGPARQPALPVPELKQIGVMEDD